MSNEPNVELDASNGPESAMEGELATVTDEEWRRAHEALPLLLDADGHPVTAGDAELT